MGHLECLQHKVKTCAKGPARFRADSGRTGRRRTRTISRLEGSGEVCNSSYDVLRHARIVGHAHRASHTTGGARRGGASAPALLRPGARSAAGLRSHAATIRRPSLWITRTGSRSARTLCAADPARDDDDWARAACGRSAADARGRRGGDRLDAGGRLARALGSNVLSKDCPAAVRATAGRDSCSSSRSRPAAGRARVSVLRRRSSTLDSAQYG